MIKYIKHLSLLLLILISTSIKSQCILEFLADDLSKDISGFKELVETSEGLESWRILNKDVPGLRSDLSRLKEVSENLSDIKKAGGYAKWKGLNTDYLNKLKSKFSDDIAFKLSEKVSELSLSSGQVDKLVADLVGDSKLLREFANKPELVEAWSDLVSIGKKIDGVPQGHAVRTNTNFLRKYSALDDARRNKLRKYLDEQKAFSRRKGEVSYSAERNIDIGDGSVRGYVVEYDEFGFPEFEKYCPNGFNANQSDLTKYFTNGKTRLDGGSNDFTAANNWLTSKFPDKDITRTSTGFKLKENGVEIEYTWHHHQNGKDIFPVPRAIHNTGTRVNGVQFKGFPHSGGASLIDDSPEIIGFFPNPKF